VIVALNKVYIQKRTFLTNKSRFTQ